MSISLIIATVNRPHDLSRALGSVAQNTVLPDELIIVDQGDLLITQDVCREFSEVLPIRLVPFAEKSLAQARNRGVQESSGDVVLFMDDDAELSKNYLATLSSYFEDNPSVIGVVGRDLLTPRTHSWKSRVSIFIRMLFCTQSLWGSSRVRRSGHNILRNISDVEESVEWLSGCGFAVRKKVFDEGFGFKKEFTRWSLGEDLLFSYQIYKRYPGALRYVPTLLFKHHASPAARLSKKEVLRMHVIYTYYFWKTEVYNNSWFNAACYAWKQFGFVLFSVVSSRASLSVVANLFHSYRYLITNRYAIEKDTINYNTFILHQ